MLSGRRVVGVKVGTGGRVGKRVRVVGALVLGLAVGDFLTIIPMLWLVLDLGFLSGGGM